MTSPVTQRRPRPYAQMLPDERKALQDEALRNVRLRDRLIDALEGVFQKYADKKQELSLRTQNEAELLRANQLYQRMIASLLRQTGKETDRRRRMEEGEQDRREGLTEQYEDTVALQQRHIDSLRVELEGKQKRLSETQLLARKLDLQIDTARKRESDVRRSRRGQPGPADGETLEWAEKLDIVDAVPDVTSPEDWVALLRSKASQPKPDADDLPASPAGRSTVLADVLRSCGRDDPTLTDDGSYGYAAPDPAQSLPSDTMARLRHHKQRRQYAEIALRRQLQQQQGKEIAQEVDAEEQQAAAAGNDAAEVLSSAADMVGPIERLKHLVTVARELQDASQPKPGMADLASPRRANTERARGNRRALQECAGLISRLDNVSSLLGDATSITGDDNPDRPPERKLGPAAKARPRPVVAELDPDELEAEAPP
eukprot:TRINITY_DN26385_c0_g1_i1.p1 TRINITY_DN26385_c0_g1~~TRINITY_DN26385_c0_g1_i1.p1  ORF type:complete len:429 (+),score=186.34 TRINITY_DN26385_c0_g1_i1:60-1346(+)